MGDCLADGTLDVQAAGIPVANVVDVDDLPAEFPILRNIVDDKEVTYQIVGEMEADIELNLISITSPIARAMIGKEVGDIVEVDAPGGVVEYEILATRYE